MINSVLHAISDHGNAILSKSIVFLGYIGIGVGAFDGYVNDTVDKIANDVAFGFPDWAAVIAIISSLSLIIKNGVDTYYKIKDRRNKDK